MRDSLYAQFDAATCTDDEVGICVRCAKAASLKRFVEHHSILGPVCVICWRTDAPYKVSDPGKRTEFTKLLRALIRFHVNEHEYNPHWGGEHSPVTLLMKPNPILETPQDAGCVAPLGDTDAFLESYFEDPYPPVDEGISIYAGHDDQGMRHIQFAISQRESRALKELRDRLLRENAYAVEAAAEALVAKLGDRVVHAVSAGSRYARARIGVHAQFQRHSEGWSPDIRHQPYQGDRLGVPPPPSARAGRLNRAGVAFLYAATDIGTAVAEVRPHPGHLVSVGWFETAKALRLACLDADIALFSANEQELDLFHFLHSTSKAMSMPVPPGEDKAYTVTQLVADCLRKVDFDGVLFKSSVGVGDNVCLFDPATCRYVEGSAQVLNVKRLAYEHEDAPMLLTPEDGDHRIE